MKVYIMRHGETVWNSKRIIQGRTNNRLSKNGISQVTRQSENFNNIKIDYIFASPLMRTMQTANIMNKVLKTKVIKDNRIIELDQKDFSGRKKETLSNEEKLILDSRADSSKLETYQMVEERAKDFINFIKENYKDKTLLIVTHGGIAQTLHLMLTNSTLSIKDSSKENKFNNAEVKEVDVI